ncbi:MAG: hypothetical protein L0H94_16825 [Nitrospira sp.]|nr:hypothetical protein [Nitrospira sp.]
MDLQCLSHPAAHGNDQQTIGRHGADPEGFLGTVRQEDSAAIRATCNAGRRSRFTAGGAEISGGGDIATLAGTIKDSRHPIGIH